MDHRQYYALVSEANKIENPAKSGIIQKDLALLLHIAKYLQLAMNRNGRVFLKLSSIMRLLFNILGPWQQI